ncbi:MAG: hypothetical protein STSR0008_23700 [Ignavibacterium sp.]
MELNIIKYFYDADGFKFSKQYDNKIVLEKYYDNLKNFSPLFNETTNELERCIVIFELQELNNNLRHIAIKITRHFPSGTDFGHNQISNNNNKSNYEPLEIFSINEFYLDETNGQFFHHKKIISFNKLLSRLYRAHIRPTKIIAGLLIRTKQKLIKYKFDGIQKTIGLIEKIMKYILGLSLKDEDSFQEIFLKPIKREQIKIVEDRRMKIPYGFECSRNEAVLSSLFLIILAILFNKVILTNSTLVIIIVVPVWVVLLFIIQQVMPILFLLVINSLIRIRDWRIFNSIRI